MKPIYSLLAEEQTLRTERITDRVSVRVRQCEDGTITRDVLVDGYCHTPMLSEKRLGEILPTIVVFAAKRVGLTHLGHGQWEARA